MVKKLSNRAPIILTWVPRVHGASLPDGKNSDLNYLDIIKNHKLINKEDRDIYLVINGPGFELNQIDDLKRELEGIEGIHVVDLHQYDWGKIDKEWKIDGEDISIKNFFENMYHMTDEQRMYFAIEIDTFRLIALALLQEISKQEGGIYVDFDSLKAIKTHIGKDITIPEGILLGKIGAHVNSMTRKIFRIDLNNDLIAISHPSIATGILSKYKNKILSQKEMCCELVKRIPPFLEKLSDTSYPEQEAKKLQNEWTKEYLEDLSNGIIDTLYKPEILKYIIPIAVDLNLGQLYTTKEVCDELISINQLCTTVSDAEFMSKVESKIHLFLFEKNNGHYVSIENDDMSWMKGEDLYHKQVDSELKEAKVDSAQAIEKLSLK